MLRHVVRTPILGLIVALMFPTTLSAAQDKSYAGIWVGSYRSDDGGSGKVSYTLSKDDKGGWRGTISYGNDDGYRTAELKSLRILSGKFSAKIESPDGDAEIAIEGTFQGDKFEGTYKISPKGSTEVVDKGTWSAGRVPTKP